MNSQVLVSIIMPVFNGDKFIGEAIDSVLDQTYDNWELLIIDDGSTDNTASIVTSFEDKRIEYIQQENAGASAARNLGLQKANGEFITFIDADDAFPKSSLDVRVKYLIQNSDIQVVGGWVRIMDSNLEILRYVKKPNYHGPFLPKLLALDEQIFSSICYLCRRDAIMSERFNEHMTNCEDLLFLIGVAARQGTLYGSVDDYIYNYRVHGESATAKEDAWRTGYIDLIENISKIDEISYRMTISMRLKIIFMLLKWHIKRKTFKNIHQLLKLMVFNRKNHH